MINIPDLFSLRTNIEQLEDMFDAVNLILYDGNLTKPKFAVGVIHMNNHCARYAPGVYENLSGKRAAEIMFNRDCLRPDNVEEIFTEILRCAVLHYSHENNMDNPYLLPEAHVRYRDGYTTASDNAKECGGNCTECAITDGGCWTLKSGEQVVFNEH